MTRGHVRVEIHGERFGDLIPIGQRFILYTTHQRIKPLDGKSFMSVDDARKAIQAALRQRSSKAA
jgi:hypothetical protein